MIDETDRSKPMVSGVLFIFHEYEGIFEGLAVIEDCIKNPSKYGYHCVGKFFQFGCQHEWQEVSWEEPFGHRFSHDHAYKCQKCGRIQIIDSSD